VSTRLFRLLFGACCLLVGILDAVAAWRGQALSSLPGDGALAAGLLVVVVALVMSVGSLVALVVMVAVSRLRLRRGMTGLSAGRGLEGAGAGLLLGVLLLQVLPIVPSGWAAWLVVLGCWLLGGVASWRVGVAVWPIVVVCVALSASGLWRSVPQAPSVPLERAELQGPTVVFLTLDTFRADHLGAIGGATYAPATPHLDGLAAEGALFVNGVAPVPLTLPSHAAMLTGREPDQLGLTRNGGTVDAAAPRIARSFQAAGYRTGAFVSSIVLRGSRGLDAGFEHYDDRMGLSDRMVDGLWGVLTTRLGVGPRPPRDRRGDQTVRRALRWLGSEPGPSFLWVHLYDPHSPYAPPGDGADAFDWQADDAPGNPAQVKAAIEARKSGDPFEIPLIGRDLRRDIAGYAAEIAWTDVLVGELMEGLPSDAVVVVASDHGESLLEHGYLLNHGSDLHEPSIRVPVIVRADGQVIPGTVVRRPVSLVDVGPTLLVLAGLPADGASLLEGPLDESDAGEFRLSAPDHRRSLADGMSEAHSSEDPSPPWEVRSFAGGMQSRRMLRSMNPWKLSWRVGADKWIVNSLGQVEHFDIGSDPGELNNLAVDDDPEVVSWRERGMAELADLQKLSQIESEHREDAVFDELRALGYLE
jgi:arylsulfatase A-like enzyme